MKRKQIKLLKIYKLTGLQVLCCMVDSLHIVSYLPAINNRTICSVPMDHAEYIYSLLEYEIQVKTQTKWKLPGHP